MDKFHIYGEIGKGKHCQVYKGREKSKLHYVAIKRVDKEQSAKVFNEVHMMHRLAGSPHTVRFYDWYETTRNLWLILEYCAGGDLGTLLRQDKGGQPMSTVTLFAIDIMAGLHYVHSRGVIFCDLRPSSILLDEYGVLKLADFALSRKMPRRPQSAGSTASNESPTRGGGGQPAEPAMRGSPKYMAPELFLDDGLPSFASDFWSFGCVLFEMRYGKAPFSSRTHQELLRRIMQDEPAWPRTRENTLGPESTAFVELVSRLLSKHPLDRPVWEELLSAPLWTGMRTVPEESRHIAMPTPPDIPDYPELARSGTSNRLLREPVSSPRRSPGATGTTAAAKPPPAAAAAAATGEATARPGSAGARTSPRHLQASSPASSRRSSPAGNDATSAAATGHLRKRSSPHHNGRPRGDNADRQHDGAAEEVADEELPGQPGVEQKAGAEEEQEEEEEEEVGEEDMEALIFDGCDLHVKPIANNKTIEVVSAPRFNMESLPVDAQLARDVESMSQDELDVYLGQLYHSLAEVSAPDRATISTVMNTLGFLCVLTRSGIVANVLLNSRFLTLLLRLFRIFKSSAAVQTLLMIVVASGIRHATFIQRKNAVLSPSPTAAAAAAADQRVLLQQQREQQSSGLLGTLARIVSTRALDVQVRRKAMAAFGEMLFYVAAQEAELEDQAEQELQDRRSDGDAGLVVRVTSDWTVTPSCVNVVVEELEDTDETTRHYAAKTLENVLSQGPARLARRFTNPAAVRPLVHLVTQPATPAHLRATATAALGHLLYHALFLAHADSERDRTPASVPASSPDTHGSTAPTVAAGAPRPTEESDEYDFGLAGCDEAENRLSPADAWSLFALLVERGGLRSLLEALIGRGSSTRLQQGLLNILNLLFWPKVPIPAPPTGSQQQHNHSNMRDTNGGDGGDGGDNGTRLVFDGTDVRMTEAYVGECVSKARVQVARSATMFQHMTQLCEEPTSATAVRAKAILALRQMCQYNAALPRRIAGTGLLETLSDLLQDAETDSYLARCTQSFLQHLRGGC